MGCGNNSSIPEGNQLSRSPAGEDADQADPLDHLPCRFKCIASIALRRKQLRRVTLLIAMQNSSAAADAA